MIQDFFCLLQLDEKGALAVEDLVLRTDPSEDLIAKDAPVTRTRHVGADLRENDGQAHASEKGGLSAHVGPRDEQAGSRFFALRTHVDVVRDELGILRRVADHGCVPQILYR